MSIKPNFPNASSQQDGLRLILETALNAVVVVKSDGIFADWNDRAVSALGWSRNEAVGRTLADLIIPERDRDAYRNGLRRYLASKQGEVLGKRPELSGLKKNGEEFSVEHSISPIVDGVLETRSLPVNRCELLLRNSVPSRRLMGIDEAPRRTESHD
jgi:PAS domain S-box-containing protein